MCLLHLLLTSVMVEQPPPLSQSTQTLTLTLTSMSIEEDDHGGATPTPLPSPSMAYLPFEVIAAAILTRLAVKDLLRLRSVSKQWRELIDSPDFSRRHIDMSTAAMANLTLLLRKGPRLFAADFPTAATVDASELLHPLMCYSNEIKVLGFCDGLLCLCNVAQDIAVWNPSTKTHRLLPSLSSDRSSEASIRGPRVYGFGFDGESYKVARVSQFIGADYQSFETEVRVFSSGAKEWKSLPDMPYALLYTKKMGVHLTGLLHWVALRRLEPTEEGVIVAVDCEAQSYREVPLPADLKRWDQLDLVGFDGKLSFVAGFRELGFEVWVMREYGVRESWTRLISLGDERFRSVGQLRPLTYSKCGREILFEEDHKKLFWYELASQRVNYVKVRGGPVLFDASVLVNSLAPVVARSRRGDVSQSSDYKNKERDNFLSEGFNLVL